MPNHQNARAHRVIAALNRDQVDFLDRLGKDALFSAGTKLSRTEILSAMVNVLRQLELTGEGVTSGTELEQRILDAMRIQRQHPDPRGGHDHD
jgi:hypothetical protein